MLGKYPKSPGARHALPCPMVSAAHACCSRKFLMSWAAEDKWKQALMGDREPK